MRKKPFIVQAKKPITFMNDFNTRKQAEKAIKEYEKEDSEDGIFMYDFYEIVENKLN